MSDPRRSELRASDTYAQARAALSPRRRRALESVEEDIAEDPLHVHWRVRVTDGSVLDYAGADDGLVVRYRVVSATQIEFVELIDLRSRHQGEVPE
jgi:hypothetical protein